MSKYLGKSVEDQLIQLCEPSNNWNRGKEAVELLVLGSVLGGTSKKIIR